MQKIIKRLFHVGVSTSYEQGTGHNDKSWFLRTNRLKELIKCLPFRCKSNLGLEAVANEVMNWGKLTSFIS